MSDISQDQDFSPLDLSQIYQRYQVFAVDLEQERIGNRLELLSELAVRTGEEDEELHELLLDDLVRVNPPLSFEVFVEMWPN